MATSFCQSVCRSCLSEKQPNVLFNFPSLKKPIFFGQFLYASVPLCPPSGDSKLSAGMKLHEFPEINNLGVGKSVSVTLGIDFGDTTQPANFEIW